MKKGYTLFCLLIIFFLTKNVFSNPFSQENGNGFLMLNTNIGDVQNNLQIEFEAAFGAAFFNKIFSITFIDLGFTNKWGYDYKEEEDDQEATYRLGMVYLGPRLAFTVFPSWPVNFSIGTGGGVGWFKRNKIKGDDSNAEISDNTNDFITYYDIIALINFRLGQDDSNSTHSISPSLFVGIKYRFVWNSQDPYYSNKELGGSFFMFGITAMFGENVSNKNDASETQ